MRRERHSLSSACHLEQNSGPGREVYFWSLIVAVLHMAAVVRMEEAIRAVHPAVKRIFIEARPRHERPGQPHRA